MDGPRFFRLAVRLPYYQGAMHVVVLGLMNRDGGPAGRGVTGQPAATPSGPVLVNVKGSGPVPLPDGARYTPSDPGSLMANPAFADKFEFAAGGESGR